MRGPTHLLIGATALMLANQVSPFIQPHLLGEIPTGLVACLAAASLGALAPDLDAEDSSIKRGLGLIGEAASAGLRRLGVQHRGLTHTGLAGLLVAFLAWGLTSSAGYGDLGLAFGLGYLSHITLGDGLTRHGVPLWWPLPGRFHLLPKPLRIRTGGPAERLIFIGLIFLLAGLLVPAVPAEYIQFLSKIF